MPLNLTRKYPELLELIHLSEYDRKKSLMSIYKRDFDNDVGVSFQTKRVYPIKSEGQIDLDRVFTHLTCKDETVANDNGRTISSRVFDMDRSQRLHWIKPHIQQSIIENDIELFSVIERDNKKRQDVERTYIYNRNHKYVIVLEPQRNKTAYYLLTAYYLNEKYGEKMMSKRLKNRLQDVL